MVLFSVGPLLVMLFGVVLLADGGGVIILFTGELVFELLNARITNRVLEIIPCFLFRVLGYYQRN